MGTDALSDNPGPIVNGHPAPLANTLRIADPDRGAPWTVTIDGPGTIHAVGEIDMTTAGLLSHFIEQEASSGGNVMLDLSGVSFIDSSGIAALLRGVSSTDRSSELVLLHPSRQVRRVLEISGVDGRPGLRILD